MTVIWAGCAMVNTPSAIRGVFCLLFASQTFCVSNSSSLTSHDRPRTGANPLMRVIWVIVALLAFWFAGCSTKRGVSDQYASAVSSDGRQMAISVTNGPPEFRRYDRQFVNTVSHRWYDLMDTFSSDRYRAGEVIVVSKLHAD